MTDAIILAGLAYLEVRRNILLTQLDACLHDKLRNELTQVENAISYLKTGDVKFRKYDAAEDFCEQTQSGV